MLKGLALADDLLLETKDHVGPVSLLRGYDSTDNLNLAAAITFRYSDAPKDLTGIVMIQKNNTNFEISTKGILEPEYLKYRI